MYPASSGDYPGSQDTEIMFDHSGVREHSSQLGSGVGAGLVLPSVGVVWKLNSHLDRENENNS